MNKNGKQNNVRPLQLGEMNMETAVYRLPSLCFNSQQYVAGFIAGCKWYSCEVWHDPSTLPIVGKRILVEFSGRQSWTSWLVSTYIQRDFEFFNVKRWAYMDDLLPYDEGEEARNG